MSFLLLILYSLAALSVIISPNTICAYVVNSAVLFVFVVATALYIFRFSLFGSKEYTADMLDGVEIIAHRGNSGHAPENSLQSVTDAMALGVDAVEVDVQMAADGELVVFHDAVLSGKTSLSGKLSQYTSEELRCATLLCGEQDTAVHTIPMLADVLELVDGKCRLLIDVKCDNSNAEAVAKALINEVSLFGASSWVSVQSFNGRVLSEIHRLGHPFPLEKLFYFKIPFLPLAYDGKLTTFDYQKYDYISSFNFYYRLLVPSLVEDIHSHGKKVKMWTVDAPQKTPALHVDGVITDDALSWLNIE